MKIIKHFLVACVIGLLLIIVCSNNQAQAVAPTVQSGLINATADVKDYAWVTRSTTYGYESSKSTTYYAYSYSNLQVNVQKVEDLGSQWLIYYTANGSVGAGANHGYRVSKDVNVTINGVYLERDGYYYNDSSYSWSYYDHNRTVVVPKQGLTLNIAVYAYCSTSGYLYYEPQSAYALLNRTFTLNLNSITGYNNISTNTIDTDAVYLNGTVNNDTYTVQGKAWDLDKDTQTVTAQVVCQSLSTGQQYQKSTVVNSLPATQPSSNNFNIALNIQSDLGLMPEGRYYCYLYITDGYNTSTIFLSYLVIDRTPPTISISTTKIKGGKQLAVATNENGYIYIAKQGSYTVEQLNSLVDSQNVTKTVINNYTKDKSAIAPLLDGYYKVYAVDRAKNVSLASTKTVVVDSTSPKLVSSRREGNDIILQYDELLDAPIPATNDFYAIEATQNNSNTVTLVANEECLGVKELYEDEENDPLYKQYYQFSQVDCTFDNPNGVPAYNGTVIDTPLEFFSNVGLYNLVYWVKDNPKNDDNFCNYRLDSKKVIKQFIVHRRPIASFSTQIVSKVGATVNLDYLDQSYDLDHNVTRADKGITARSWQYKKTTSDTWLDGKPSSLTYNTGIYQIKLQVKDLEGAWSKPYIDTIDTANLVPTIDASPTTYNGFGPLSITITASDNGEGDLVLAGSSYSPKTRYSLTNSATKPSNGWTDLPTKAYNLPTIATDGIYYLHMEAYDTSGQKFYRVRGPYTIETLKASHFYITMMLDVDWRPYYFNIENGIDDDHDGEIDRYPKRTNTDIDTLKMPINYYNLVGHSKNYIKAGYKVKGKIDIIGNPDWAKFDINYIKEGKTYTDTVPLTRTTGDTFTFEWIIPLETDTKTFVSFDLITKKDDKTYGNERWLDTWDARNTSRLVFYVKGKATDDIIYVQSQ